MAQSCDTRRMAKMVKKGDRALNLLALNYFYHQFPLPDESLDIRSKCWKKNCHNMATHLKIHHNIDNGCENLTKSFCYYELTM